MGPFRCALLSQGVQPKWLANILRVSSTLKDLIIVVDAWECPFNCSRKTHNTWCFYGGKQIQFLLKTQVRFLKMDSREAATDPHGYGAARRPPGPGPWVPLAHGAHGPMGPTALWAHGFIYSHIHIYIYIYQLFFFCTQAGPIIYMDSGASCSQGAHTHLCPVSYSTCQYRSKASGSFLFQQTDTSVKYNYRI